MSSDFPWEIRDLRRPRTMFVKSDFVELGENDGLKILFTFSNIKFQSLASEYQHKTKELGFWRDNDTLALH